MPPDLLGPLAGLALALLVARELWESHKRSDADVLATRDRALSGWEAQTAATNRTADALEQQSRELAQALADKRET